MNNRLCRLNRISRMSSTGYERYGRNTSLVHAGNDPDPQTGAVAVPISLSTTYAQSSPGVPPGQNYHLSYGKGFEYSRSSNPTRNAFEIAIAAAEKGKHGLSFASGLAATVAVLHATCKAGDAVICIDDVYGGTQRYFRRIAGPQYGIEFIFIDTTVEGELDKALRAAKEQGKRVKLVWLESPTNPTLKITDIAAAAQVVAAHGGGVASSGQSQGPALVEGGGNANAGPLLCVDNTFMSPYFQNPLELGADMVMHSVTKYINGHSDVVGGVVVVRDDALANRMRFAQNSMGGVPSPFDAYMVLRGLKTLHVRMDRHASNAMVLAKWLEAHPGVERVLYPGLPSHPQHAVAVKQSTGHGGMITFYIKGGLANARTFLESVQLFVCAESLGAVESLAESPAVMTHSSVPPDVRAQLGISDTLVRLSVGIEDVQDLQADLEQALKKAAAV